MEEIPTSESFASPVYLIALCSNDLLPDNALAESNSFYMDISNSDQTKDFSRWAQRLNREATHSRNLIADLQQQLEQRTNWALDLNGQIKGKNDFIEMLQKELEGRTQWALSLESDVAKERTHANEANRELSRIRKDISASFLYRVFAKLKLLPNVWGG